GITGVRFIQTDFFDPERYPLPSLPFEPPWNYVPSAPSTLKNVEEAAIEIINRLPMLADRAKDTLADMRKTLGSIDRLAASLQAEDGSFNRALQELRAAAARVDKAIDEAKLGATTASMRDASASVGLAAAGGGEARGPPPPGAQRRLLPRAHRVAGVGGGVRVLRGAPLERPAGALRGARAGGAARGDARAQADG